MIFRREAWGQTARVILLSGQPDLKGWTCCYHERTASRSTAQPRSQFYGLTSVLTALTAVPRRIFTTIVIRVK